MALIDRQRKLHEIGRIRLGVKVAAKKRDGSDTTRPDKLSTFRFTSQNQDAINSLADVHGGEVLPWADAPVGKQFEVVTETDKLRVLVPPESMSFSQHYELWSGGGCVRRCDGERLDNDDLCLCDPDNRECSPHSRVSVMLADIPTSGLWRVDTQSEYAADELGGAFELAKLLGAATGQSVLPGTLRLEQREKRKPGEQTKKFAVVVLDFDVDIRAFAGNVQSLNSAPPVGQLTPGVTPIAVDPDDDGPLPSVADQMQAAKTPAPRKQTARSATPLPATHAAPRTSAEINAAARTTGGVTPGALRRLFAIANGNKTIPKDDEGRHAWATEALGHSVESFNDLTPTEVSRLSDVAEGKIGLYDTAPPAHEPGQEPF